MKKLILVAGFYCIQLTLHASSHVVSCKTDIVSVKKNIKPVSADERAIAHFRENFPEVKDVSWSTNPDKSINCSFHQGAKVGRVYYDPRGYWRYTVISYPPSYLSNNIRYRIMDNFDGNEISYVNEILSKNNDPVYMVNIENVSNIKVIRVSDDDIEVKQVLRKW
jgi:hypothetical protein